MPAYELLSAPIAALLRSRAAGLDPIPRPRDEPATRSGDPLADRLLLIGNGRATGWGVATHQLALPGTLSRALTSESGGPVDIDFVGGSLMHVGGAIEWLGSRARNGYRAALVMVGISDAMHLLRSAIWRRKLTELLTTLDTDLPPGAPLFVTTIPPIVGAVEALGMPLPAMFAHHTRRMNAITRQVVAGFDRGILIEDDEAGYDPTKVANAANDYRARALAERLAPSIQPGLDAAPSQPAVSFRAPSTWTAKELAFKSDGSGDGPLQRLITSATREFDVRGGSVTILDGEHIWVAASSVDVPPWLPRDLSFCETTAKIGDAFIVADASKDPRFRDNPLVRELGSRFYAGCPIRDAQGATIGAVCLVDDRRRSMSEAEIDRLRTLARRAELHLHDLERRLHPAR